MKKVSDLSLAPSSDELESLDKDMAWMGVDYKMWTGLIKFVEIGVVRGWNNIEFLPAL